ncbi:hypothetical protein WJX72_011696 [[Myrmecia] bisecta]|uniref:Uncharacterized protein n=1 Tax=[Myrmecia] bisecta TaxID=41462 RepID=A0AAW1P8Q2_9CHLO
MATVSCRSTALAMLGYLLLTTAAGQGTLNLVANTPQPGQNTFISQLASALLGGPTPGLFWGSVTAADVNAASAGDKHWRLWNAQLSAGVETAFMDAGGRRSAVICDSDPAFVTKNGCGVFLTGPDISSLYTQGVSNITTGSGRKLAGAGGTGCAAGGAVTGGIALVGAAQGIAGVTAACAVIAPPLLPFCLLGGATAAIVTVGIPVATGALVGCVSNVASGSAAMGCFPGDALVELESGGISRMDQLRIGDAILVTGVRTAVAMGLFNPFTTGGHLVVDGVLVSAHSAWFMDHAFKWLGVSASHLPAVYQAVMAPARALYHLLGDQRSRQLDATLNLSSSGTCGYPVAMAAGLLLLALPLAACWRCFMANKSLLPGNKLV